jgi:hypothetical protein
MEPKDGKELSDSPPEIEFPNAFPVEWHIDTPRLEDMFNVYVKSQWNPFDIPWSELDKNGFDQKQKIAMCYYWSTLATFENSIAPVLAQAVVHEFENHFEDPVKKLTGAFVMDECRHDQCCKMACNALCPGFPWNYKAKDDFEKRALRNIEWVYYNGSRYWKALRRSFGKESLPITLAPFTLGEIIAGKSFLATGRKSKNKAYEEFFSHINKDESRHFAFLWALTEKHLPEMTAQQKATLTKRLRSAFVLLSVHFYNEPIVSEFWKLPKDFIETHHEMEHIAQDAGLGIPDEDEKKRLWRDSFKRLNEGLEKYGVEATSTPELD